MPCEYRSRQQLTSHVRDLQQHGRHQIDTLQQLQVDVHVEGHLSGLLNLLLFTAAEYLLMLSLGQQSLSNQFLAAAPQLNVKQSIVTVLDLTMSEATESQLDHGSVVQDLGDRVTMVHGVLQITKCTGCHIS